ncbi:MAG: PhoH family protein [Planctomycetota bacterium]
MLELTIPLRSHDEAILVLGPYDRHAKLLRKSLDIELFTRGGNLRLKGAEGSVEEARQRIDHLLGKHRKGRELQPRQIEDILSGSADTSGVADGPGHLRRVEDARPGATKGTDGRGRGFAATGPGAGGRSAPRAMRISRPHPVEPRTQNQRRYLELIERHALTFGLGAAGTGKTFLATVAAVRALSEGTVRRLVITRPVVEAGERLGFLPGDLQAKLDPYLRPIYDALYALLPFEEVGQLEEAGVIEIAPLAYMRGRTLSNSFVILDEAQNTTRGQMKMFLTRLGEGSKMVVTGDPTQTDLVGRDAGGLVDGVRRLKGFAGIGVVEFGSRDIVRHPLVEQIVRAYEGASHEGGDGEVESVDKSCLLRSLARRIVEN